MKISDKFTRGWASGACGGLVGGIIGFLPYCMGISTMRPSDWSAILVYGRVPPFSFAEQLYALIVLAISTGMAGVVFAFLLSVINEKNIYFKGWVFYLLPWWVIYFVTALAKTEGTLNLSLMTEVSDAINTSITGLAAVFFYRLMKPKT